MNRLPSILPSARWCGLLVLFTTLQAAPALAQDLDSPLVDTTTHRIAVLVRTRHDSLRPFAARSQALMRQWLLTSGRYVNRPLHAQLDSGGSSEAAQQVRDGRGLLQNGFNAFRKGQVRDAADLLGEAIRSFEQGLAALDDLAPLAQANQLLGALKLEAGEHREAVRHFSRALSLAPTSPLDPAVFPTETAEVYERTRQEGSGEQSRLEVITTPARATILLDGRFVGITPAQIEVSAAGHHVLRLLHDDHLPSGQALDLVAGKQVTVQRTLSPIRRREVFLGLVEQAMQDCGQEELSADDAINQIGELLDIEELVLVRIEATRDGQALLQGYHYDLLDGQLRNVGDLLVSPRGQDTDGETTRFLDDLTSARLDLALEGTVALAALPPTATYGEGAVLPGAAAAPAPSTGRGSLLTSPWLWAGVGGAAALAGGTAAALLLGGEEEEPSKPRETRLLFGFE